MGPNHSREEAFLAGAARAFVHCRWGGDVPDLVVPPLDWEWVLRRAEDERLASLLYAVLRSLPSPVPILDRLHTAWVAGRRQHLLGVEQLRGLLSAFEADGVPVILLKGPALAEALYRDPGLRPFTDLDLLVPKPDLPRALQLLSELGYRHLAGGRPLEFELNHAGAACFVSEGREPAGFPLDLHWELVTHPGVALAPVADIRQVWDRAVKVECWSRTVLALSPEDLLIYLALHLAIHHALSGLSWQLDLALLLRRHGGAMDWETVAERALRWCVAGALYFALREVQERFGVGPPRSLLARLRPSGLRSSVLDWLRRRKGEQLERLDYLVPLLLMDQGSDLLWLLATSALPPGGWTRSRYGKASLLGAYRAHYGRIGRACVRTVRASFGRAR